MRALMIWIAALALVPGAIAADRGEVVQGVRAELAKLLKKEAAKLPVDKPVIELGADDLTVVEWVMALEKTYGIRISDEKTVDPKSKTTRKDLTISSMAAIVADAPSRAKGRK